MTRRRLVPLALAAPLLAAPVQAQVFPQMEMSVQTPADAGTPGTFWVCVSGMVAITDPDPFLAGFWQFTVSGARLTANPSDALISFAEPTSGYGYGRCIPVPKLATDYGGFTTTFSFVGAAGDITDALVGAGAWSPDTGDRKVFTP